MSVEMSVTGETRQVLREENPYSIFKIQCSMFGAQNTLSVRVW